MPWTGAPIRVGFTEGIPWEPPDLGFSIANVELETDDSYSLLSLYRRLIQFRSTSNALRFGATAVIEPGTTDLYVVARSYGSQHVVVVMNMTGREVADYSIDLSQIVTGGATATPLFGVLDEEEVIDPTTYRPLASIPPYAAIIIEIVTDE